MPLPSPLLTVEFRCPVFCGHTASSRSSYKSSRVGSSRTHCSPRGVPGRCGWDARALQVSGGLPGLKDGGWDADAPIATLTAGVAAVRCARCPAGHLLPCLHAAPPLAPPRAGTRFCAPPLASPPLPHPSFLRPPLPSARFKSPRAAPHSAFKVPRGTLSRSPRAEDAQVLCLVP